MKKTAEHISYNLPNQFRYCILSECPNNTSCLRYQAFSSAPDDMQYFSTLNPTYLLKQDLAHCNQFYSQDMKVYVAGLNGMMEDMPLRKIQKI